MAPPLWKKSDYSLWKFESAWLVTTLVNQELTDARGGFSGSKRLYQYQRRSSFLTNLTTHSEMRRSTSTTPAFLFHHADTELRTFGVVLMPVSNWWPAILPLYSISVNKSAFLHVSDSDCWRTLDQWEKLDPAGLFNLLRGDASVLLRKRMIHESVIIHIISSSSYLTGKSCFRMGSRDEIHSQPAVQSAQLS